MTARQAKQVCGWLSAGKYRVIMHRHTGFFRSVDESERKKLDADDLPTLCEALENWDTEARSYEDRDYGQHATIR